MKTGTATFARLTSKQWRWVGLWAANLVFIIAVWASLSLPKIDTGTVPAFMAISRLAGLLAYFTVLTQLLLIGRGRWLERDFGFDRLTRIHRWNGFASVIFVVTHVFTLIIAQSTLLGIAPSQVLPIILANYEDTTKALIAELSLFAIVISSLVIARRRLKYEYWYYVHLLTYVVVILAFGHQLSNGLHLLSYNWFRFYWIGLFLISLGSLIIYRVIRPFWLWNRHRFRVARVVTEANGVHSIYLSGRNIAEFNYEAGQFAKYWFVAKGFWLEEHPFSISMEPGGAELRITPKAIGDFTTKLGSVLEGTPVVVDGPYGRFVTAVANHKKLVLIAGGIGITPLRAMLGALAKSNDKRSIVLYYSVKTPADIVFAQELERLQKQLNLRLQYIVSDPITGANEKAPKGAWSDMLTISAIKEDLKSLKKTSFFVCGPPAMMKALRAGLSEGGVAHDDIHYEQFSLVKQ